MYIRKQKYSIPLTRRDLGFGIFDTIDLKQDNNFMKEIIPKIGNPLLKILHFLFHKEILPIKRVIRLKEYFLELSDGAKLATDIFLPYSTYKNKGKAPTILIRLPYWKDTLAIVPYYMALNGYAAVIQDIRGCAHSSKTGTNSVFFSERKDGFETYDWLKKQFWWNGKIGTWGSSYFGFTQWAISWNTDRKFTCLNPSFFTSQAIPSSHNGLDHLEYKMELIRIMDQIAKYYDSKSPYDYFKDEFQKITERKIRNPKFSLYDAPINDPWDLRVEEFNGLDLEEKIQRLKRIDKNYSISNPSYDAYHKIIRSIFLDFNTNFYTKYAMGMQDFDVKKLNSPLLMFNGWYDIFSKVTMDSFIEIQKEAPREIAKQCKIICGPWIHANIGYTENNPFKQISFLLSHIIPWKWFDYWLKEQKNGTDLESPILLYTMGKESWRYEEEWPIKNTIYKKLYLASNGNANSLYGDGVLVFKKGELTIQNVSYQRLNSEFDEYIFDPLHPVITRGGNNLMIPAGTRDQRPIEMRKDVLVYTSNLVEKGLEITGNLNMVLCASSDCEDTDFMVKLCDVYPNGKSINIIDRGIRARFRNGVFNKPSLIEPGKIYQYQFPIGVTSYFIRPNHKIRIEISSSNYPRFDINSNLGGKRKSKFDYKKANQRIFHSDNYNSYIILPIIPEKLHN